MREPAAVYRRRRLTALGVAGGAVVLVVVAVGSCGSSADRSTAAKGSAKRPLVVDLPRGGRRIFPDYRVVAFYGAPQDAQLGELGIGTPGHAARKLLRQAAPYGRKTRPVLPAMELIASVAAHDPGPDGLYRTQQTPAVINRYLHAARRIKALLVLDIQPGHADFLSEARRLAPWLGQPDVGIALDPEWHTPGAVPGTQIGSVTAAEINAVSDYVAGIVRARNLPEKLFVIHPGWRLRSTWTASATARTSSRNTTRSRRRRGAGRSTTASSSSTTRTPSSCRLPTSWRCSRALTSLSTSDDAANTRFWGWWRALE